MGFSTVRSVISAFIKSNTGPDVADVRSDLSTDAGLDTGRGLYGGM